MKNYVAGLMFSEDRTKVALVRKNKPDWQKGLLNGIGGKIELEDSTMCHGDAIFTSSKNAMIREFKEETGVDFDDWNLFLNMNGNNTDEQKSEFSVDFYRCFTNKVFDCKTMEDEEIEIHDVTALSFNYDNSIGTNKTIDNLHWIILLALDKNPKFTEVKY